MKPDERELLTLFQQQAWRLGESVGRTMPRQLIAEQAFMCEKRAHFILGKWTGKGWYEYGTVIDGGWMTDEGLAASLQ